MPKISIIIAAYNVGDYLEQCLDSVLTQTYADFEAIVVDDASTDNTADIIQQTAANDSRITLVQHSQNLGLHLTRKTGVEKASGEYAFFLDGDDDLAPNACEQFVNAMEQHPVDILHFGITVIGENGIHDDERKAFESFNNAPTPDSMGKDIVRDIFDESRGQRVDWRVTQRLFRTDLLKKSFASMSSSRLERAEDGYECLVISSLASSYRSEKTAADISIITDAELLAPIRFPHRNMVFSANSSKPVSMQHKSIPIATLNSIYKIVWMDIVGKPPNYLPTISMSVLQMTKKRQQFNP